MPNTKATNSAGAILQLNWLSPKIPETLSAIASFKGVNILRVHDFDKHFSAILIGDAIRMADKSEDINFEAYKK